MSRHPVRCHARLAHRPSHRRRDAAVEIVDAVYVTIDSDIHYEAAPHAALGNDVLPLTTFGDADDPASRCRRDVAAASERLHRCGRLEPGERDFEARGDVAEGFGRAVERIRVLDPGHRFFPGEVAKL